MIDNLLNHSLGSFEFATTRGTFDSILVLAMPIDRRAIVQMNDASARSPRSHVSHEISVNE